MAPSLAVFGNSHRFKDAIFAPAELMHENKASLGLFPSQWTILGCDQMNNADIRRMMGEAVQHLYRVVLNCRKLN